MPVRTCDLRELVGLVEERVAHATGPVTVAIAGIETSGKSTLAALLTDRLRGTAAEQRVVVVEARDRFPSAVDPGSDVRVWMDVSPNTAAGWRIRQRIAEARRRGVPPPYGSWHAFPPEGSSLDDGYADPASVRPDGADVLFVPVSGMVPPARIRFMPEAGCDFVLWDDENEHLGELEDLLPMPAGLRRAVKAWADRYSRHDGGALALSSEQIRDLEAEGERLSRQLQQALGPDYVVVSSL